MAMRIRDWTPGIRPAGKTLNKPSNVGISAELTDPEVPPTPKNVAPFRKSFQARVGLAAHHWGSRNDAPIPDYVHGEANKYESSAEECLRAAASNKGLSALSAENAEKKYNRNKKEPLGRSAEPLYPLPGKTQKENFAFGVASDKSENAKGVIYNGGDRDSERITNADPGRQKDRKYDWARVGIDPTRARFGRASSADPITTKELCQPANPTRILPKIVQDHHNVAHAHQGQCKNLGFGSRSQTKDFVYGFSRRSKNDMGTRLLIGGSGVEPASDDPSLGRPVCRSVMLRRLREKDAEARGDKDKDRTFGCPGVRTDLPRPKYRKVTNPNNYGDEPTGGSLLYPNPHGVNEEAFLEKMTAQQIRTLLKSSGVPGATPEQVEQAIQTVFKGKSDDATATMLEINNVLDSYNA